MLGWLTLFVTNVTKKFADQGLTRHWAKCQGNEGEFDCPDCGETFESVKNCQGTPACGA